MAIDIAADILEILGATADFTRTAGTYTSVDGSTSDSINLIFVELSFEPTPDGGLDVATALGIAGDTEFTNVTVRAPQDTLAISGYRTFDVVSVRDRIGHVAMELVAHGQRAGR